MSIYSVPSLVLVRIPYINWLLNLTPLSKFSAIAQFVVSSVHARSSGASRTSYACVIGFIKSVAHLEALASTVGQRCFSPIWSTEDKAIHSETHISMQSGRLLLQRALRNTGLRRQLVAVCRVEEGIAPAFVAGFDASASHQWSGKEGRWNAYQTRTFRVNPYLSSTVNVEVGSFGESITGTHFLLCRRCIR